MPKEYERDVCEVCNDQQASTIPSNIDGVHQNCPRCGEFKVSGTANSIMRQGLGKEKRARLSGWVREQNRAGAVPMITTDNLHKILARPLPSVAERATALLIEAERGLNNLGDRFNIKDPRFLAATYSSDQKDVIFLLGLLKEQHLAEVKEMGGGSEILPLGYIRLDEVRKRTSSSSQGFVAMWFHTDLDQIYSTGFEVGVFQARYRQIWCMRVNQAAACWD